MKLKEKISWLMGTVQQSLFPYLDECLPGPMTEPEKHLVKILELVQIEKYVPVSAKRQWLGRRLKEREALARAFIAKSALRYQHTSSLRHALLSTPNLRMICGFSKRQDVPSEATFSRAFAEYAKASLGTEATRRGRVLRGHISSLFLIRPLPSMAEKLPGIPLPFLHAHHSHPNPTGLRPRSFQGNQSGLCLLRPHHLPPP